MKAKIVKRCIAAGEWRATGDVVEIGAEEYEILFRSGSAEQVVEADPAPMFAGYEEL